MCETDDACAQSIRERDIAGHQDHRHAGGMELAEELQGILRLIGIEIPQRLVGDQDQGLVGNRPGDGRTCLLPGGEFVRESVTLLREIHPAQEFLHPALDHRVIRSVHLERECDILGDCAHAQEFGILEHNAHLAAEELQCGTGDCAQIRAVDSDRPAGRSLCADEEREQDGLPRAARSQDTDALMRFNAQ